MERRRCILSWRDTEVTFLGEPLENVFFGMVSLNICKSQIIITIVLTWRNAKYTAPLMFGTRIDGGTNGKILTLASVAQWIGCRPAD